MTKNKRLTFLFAAATFASVFSNHALALYYESNTIMWSPGDVIPVCWTTTGAEPEKARIREVLANTWLTVANISLSGFGICPTTGSQQFVRIYVHGSPEGGSYWAEGGKWALKNPSTELRKSPQVSMELYSPSGLNIDRNIVHEFGHLLGFSHEQERPDNPVSQQESCNAPGSIPGIYLSGFDTDTAMNYCSAQINREGFLTAKDVEGAQKAYPFGVPVVPLSVPTGAASDVRSVVFYRGRSNAGLRHQTIVQNSVYGLPDTSLPSPVQPVGAVESSPAILVQPNSVLLFWKGRDGKLWQREAFNYMDTSAGGTVLEAGPLTSAPQVAEGGGSRVLVWQAKQGTDDYIYARRGFTSSPGWMPAVQLGKGIQPTVVASLPGVFEIYWRGSDNGLWRMQSQSGGISWLPAERLATGPLDSAPYAIGQPDGTTDVFWRGVDKSLYQWHGNYYTTAKSITRLNSGTMSSDPSPTLTTTGKMHVFWSGSDKRLWSMYWPVSSLNPVWSSAVKLDEVSLLEATPRAQGNETGAIDVAWTTADKRIALKRYRPTTGWISIFYVPGPAM